MQQEVFFSTTVYMDQRDISIWCPKVTWTQPDRYLEQEFAITTHAWHLFSDTARYDIYASYDPDNPHAVCAIRQGWVLPDRRRDVKVAKGSPPMVTVVGKSWSSVSFRKSSDETIVMIPVWGDSGYNLNYARKVIANYEGTVGRIRVLPGAARLDQAVFRLCLEASLSVSWCMPTYPMAPVIIPPGKSYWDAILDLVEPYAPEIYYNEFGNSVVFADSISRYYGRTTLSIPGSMVDRLTAVPVKSKSVKRCLVKVNAWP